MSKLTDMEEKFVVAKKAGKVTAKMREELRAARQKFRETERGVVGAVVQPATVNAKAGVHG